MSRNGSGVYTPPNNSFPAVPDTLIEADKFNTVINDISNALSSSISADGQTTITGNIPLGNNRITGLANAVNANDAVNKSQLDSIRLSSIAELKALDKTKHNKATTYGYYTSGDYGGGEYWYDSSDNSSADNGGSVIVATDGGRWKLLATNCLNVRQFGAKGDGVTDDYAAIMAAFNASINGNVLYFPSGTYKVNTAIVFSNKRLAYIGDGSRQTKLVYAGANTTNDCFTFGDGVSGNGGLRIRGIGFESSTLMTAGTGVKLNGLVRSSLDDVLFSHQDGNKNFYHGVWFNGCDFVTCSNFQTKAQKDSFRVCGIDGIGKAELHLNRFKIASSEVGVRIGGNFGGFKATSGDIINNATNVIIDKTLVNVNNREIWFSSPLSIDSACSTNDAATFDGINVDIQDTSGFLFFDNAWNASSANNIRIASQYGGTVVLGGGIVYNAFTTWGGNGRAIDNASTNAQVVINGTEFKTCQGAGIYSSVTSSKFFLSDIHFNDDVVNPISSNISKTSTATYQTQDSYNFGKSSVGARAITGGAANGNPTFYISGDANYLTSWNNTVGNPWSCFAHSKGGSEGVHVALTTNDQLGGLSFEGSDGSVFRQGAAITAICAGAVSSNVMPTDLRFKTHDGSSLSERLRLKSNGNLIPIPDNAYSLGDNTNRWASVWAANGTIQTSDERTKTEIQDSDLGLDFINAIRPVSYKFKIGGKKVIEQVYRNSKGKKCKPEDVNANPSEIITEDVPGDRKHYGMLAQQIKKILPKNADFGGWVKVDVNNPDSDEGLRYEEFISPIIKAIQELSAKVAALEAKK